MHIRHTTEKQKHKPLNVGKAVNKPEPMCAAGKDTKQCRHCGKIVWKFLKNLSKIAL